MPWRFSKTVAKPVVEKEAMEGWTEGNEQDAAEAQCPPSAGSLGVIIAVLNEPT